MSNVKIRPQESQGSLFPILLIILGLLEPVFGFVLFFLFFDFFALYRSLFDLKYVFLVLIFGSAIQIIYGIIMIVWEPKKIALLKKQKRIGSLLLAFSLFMMIMIPCVALSARAIALRLNSQPSYRYYHQLPDIYSGRFTIQYPLNWESKSSMFENGGSYSAVSLEGKEGMVETIWGQGAGKFKFPCLKEYEKIKFGNKKLEACITGRNIDSESWEFVGFRHNNYDYFVKVQVKPPFEINKPFVFKILETFKFTN